MAQSQPHSSTTHTASGATGAAAPKAVARAAALPCWRLAPIDPLEPPFYLGGVPTSLIVAAATDTEARAIASGNAGPHDGPAWSDDSLSSCDPLAPEAPGVIAADFSPAPPPPPPDVPPPPPPVNVDVPHVSGDGSVGQTLTCTMGNWEGEPTSYDYAWASDGSPNAAINETYWVAPSDAGHEITCVVTATNAGGSTTAPPSNAVAIAAD